MVVRSNPLLSKSCTTYLRAVVAQAVVDVARHSYVLKYGGSRRYVTFYRDALPWLMRENSTCKFLCSLADLPISRVRELTRDLQADPCDAAALKNFSKLFGKSVADRSSLKSRLNKNRKYYLSH